MTVLHLLNHLLPLVITLVILAAGVSLYFGFPYLHYVYLVAQAHDEPGEIKLAKHLAKKTGGKAIDSCPAWKGFIPAAKELHRLHRHRVINLLGR